MPKHEGIHFDSYREQTRVKHVILVKYLHAYFTVLTGQHSRLVYVDGFAGRGFYEDEGGRVHGSPIRALEAIASSSELSKKVHCLFVEHRAGFFEDLNRTVGSWHQENPGLIQSVVQRGKFADVARDLLSARGSFGSAPTFMFVDPCGVKGVPLHVVTDVLARPQCEVFRFFYLDGVRRMAGASVKSGRLDPILVEVYGSENRATAAVEKFARSEESASGEACLLDEYMDALRVESGAKFILPLRVESDRRRATSHYLLHASKHALGFKIMKSVMWSSSAAIEVDGARLALMQASNRGGPSLFSPTRDDLERSVIEKLRAGPRQVSYFLKHCVSQPDDMYSDGVYKQVLLALEDRGAVEVLDGPGGPIKPASKRRLWKGEATLGTSYYVRLSEE